jgi:tripartite-type tricarboxylate transporter receptor subunit TctC
MLLKKSVVLISITLVLGLAAPVRTAEGQGKFPSKNITFIVPLTPGGGFDTNARLIAPFLKKYLPGHPNVIIKNVPGGESRIGIMEMYKARPDGHTVCIFNIPGNLMAQIVGLAEADLTKVAWIGRITDSIYVTALAPKSKLRTLEDLRKAPPLKVGVVGLTSTANLGMIISAQEMGFKVRLIRHDGSQESILSTIRGDTDLVIHSFPTLRKFIVDSKDLMPFVVYYRERLKELPETPTIGELGYSNLLDLVTVDYMVGTTPGIPEDVLRTWRDAFDKAVSDPEYQKIMREYMKLPIGALKGHQAEQKVRDYIKTYSKYKELILQYSPK